MTFLRTALQAAGPSKSRIVWLVIQSFGVALLESLTLLLLFGFVSNLVSTDATASAGTSGRLLSELQDFNVVTLAFLILGLATIRFVLAIAMEWQMSKLWVGIRSYMQKAMLALHLGARHSFLMDSKSGEHIHNIMEGPAFAAVFYLHLVRFLATGIMLLVLFATLLLISPALMGLAAVIALIYGLFIRQLSSSISFKLGKQQADAIKNQISLASEGIAGLRYLKMLNCTQMWVKQFSASSDIAESAMTRAGFWNTVPNRVMEYLVLVFFLSAVIYALLAGSDLMASVPTMAVYFLGIVRVLPTLSTLGNGRMQMMHALPNLQKFIELLNTIPQEKAEGKTQALPDTSNASIRFNDISFSYHDKDVLSQANFELPPRSITMIVGPSGQGKSTILDILLGFVATKKGHISVGNKDIQDFDLHLWRNKFAYVGQDPFLFHDSLRENLRLGNPSANEADLNQAIKYACADEFVDSLAYGLDTVLADRGNSLSGGQRQRIAIARALVSPAETLLLDEPTSALDSETEHTIIQNLVKLKQDKRIVLITHRAELLAYADQVLFIQNGKIRQVRSKKEAEELCRQYTISSTN